MTDLILLAMLLDGPRHGYRLKQEAGTVLGQGELHNNLVYPLLRRFMANRWVTKKVVPGARGQNRQQYAITPLGRQSLLNRLREFSPQEAKAEDAFRLRVGLFGLLTPEERERILSQREEVLLNRAQKLGHLQNTIELRSYSVAVVTFMREQTETELAWIGRLRQLRFETAEE